MTQISEYEKDLAECRLLVSQHEARMKTLQESMRETENKKRTLEEELDSLREECAKMKAAGNYRFDYFGIYLT
jgi:kinesin family protein 5